LQVEASGLVQRLRTQHIEHGLVVVIELRHSALLAMSPPLKHRVWLLGDI
jgi:hypothetical protein